MPALQKLERERFQEALADELHRGRRYGHPFVVVLFEDRRGPGPLPPAQKLRAALEIVRRSLRVTDKAYAVFDDAIAAILIETDAARAGAAIHRLANRLIVHTGGWNTTILAFPADDERLATVAGLVP